MSRKVVTLTLSVDAENNEEAWEEYDRGVYNGIRKLVKEEVALLKNSHE
jgi:hypothetical protein